MQVLCGDKQISTATISILDEANGGKEKTVSSIGTGPVGELRITYNLIDSQQLYLILIRCCIQSYRRNN